MLNRPCIQGEDRSLPPHKAGATGVCFVGSWSGRLGIQYNCARSGSGEGMSVDEAVPTQSENQPVKKKITLEDCKSHNKEEDCWLVISGKVYDVTEFLDEHPGGFDIVLAATGNRG